MSVFVFFVLVCVVYLRDHPSIFDIDAPGNSDDLFCVVFVIVPVNSFVVGIFDSLRL